MKKLTVLVVIFALLGLLFANSIIPSVGVRDVAAYPPPVTPTFAIPQYPNNYLYWNGYSVFAVCPDCASYSGGAEHIMLTVHYQWRGSWWSHVGNYWGRTVPTNYPVYRVVFDPPPSIFLYGDGCEEYLNVYGYLDNHMGYPYFRMGVYFPGSSTIKQCVNYVPMVKK